MIFPDRLLSQSLLGSVVIIWFLLRWRWFAFKCQVDLTPTMAGSKTSWTTSETTSATLAVMTISGGQLKVRKLLGFWHEDHIHKKYNDRQYWIWILPYSCLIIKKCSQLKISRRDDGLSSVDIKSETETLRPDSPDDLSEYQWVPTKSRSSRPFRTSCSNLLGRPTI